MSYKNITVIGGGSVNWMYGLMKDVFLIDEIEGGNIKLVDPDKEYTGVVCELLKTFNKVSTKDFRITIEENRKKAFERADFVLLTFSPGSLDAFENDLEIPVKYGIVQPVSMTVGPSGISSALRTIPVAYKIAEEMEEICPGAWILNETNPMSVVTKALTLPAKTVKVIGLCHGIHELRLIANSVFGLKMPDGMPAYEYLYDWLEKQEFEYKVAGLNHFIFLTEARYKGRDIIPEIRKFCNEYKANFLTSSGQHSQATTAFSSSHGAAIQLCKIFGYIPINYDRHTVEFMGNLCNVHNGFGMKYGVEKTTIDYRRIRKQKQYEFIKKIVCGSEEIIWRMSGEELPPIMRAIATNKKFKTVVNVPNTGQIPSLQKGAVVETLGYIDAEGITPIKSDLPKGIDTLCRLHVDIQELTLQAALEGRRDLLEMALAIDPLCNQTDLRFIPEMANELLESNKQWLPQFFK